MRVHKKSHQVMVALDNMSETRLYEFLESLPEDLPWVKIGLEQFMALGKSVVKTVHERYQKRIFLDLKLHDIPNTVAKALISLSDLPVEFITVHLSGGSEMLRACQKVRSEVFSHVNILGVSYLTSLDESDFERNWGYKGTDERNQAFNRLFNLAIETNTQGIVCSPLELSLIRGLSKDIITVCPGIRFKEEIEAGNIDDQKRVLTPKEAFESEASYLVMGRSLTLAQNINEKIELINR